MFINLFRWIFRNDSPKILGRWNIDYCNKKIDNKIYLANIDHCGSCGNYGSNK